ncbi:Rid family hydrolase [Actibacterium sp. 188UL27-1]|uniref:Rid family hydrolase n=1 Tax=Actibacterium sp. 188UL27-1 TaxID=2786961 RepID=UPI00195DC921|nr:Rid family hydrolase [Actibacterium sp. 188UL27-1]MBM7067607.1 RidA family protein [Actibacterium sp. 188UL27-1]
MTKKAIIPTTMIGLYRDWKMAPASEMDGFLFLTGFSGMGPDGVASTSAAIQIETAFDQIFEVLGDADLDARHIVEVTSYHVGLKGHLGTFKRIWADRMCEPYPAWTAIEVVGFASEGVMVEMRVVAHRQAADPGG